MALVGDKSGTSKEANVDLLTSNSETNEVSSDILQMITSMKANTDRINDLIAALMAERNHPPTWALDENENPSFQRYTSANQSKSVASMNAIPAAAKTATLRTAQTATLRTAQTATLRTAQTATLRTAQTAILRTAQTATSQPAQAEPTFESRETFIDPMQRSFEEDVLSLYGGKKFDDHQDTDLEGEADNDSFLQALNEWLLPSEDYDPPYQTHWQKL